MGCTCGSEPSAPAPIIVKSGESAAQQASFNKEAAVQQRDLNLMDQYTPQGSVEYSPIEDEFSSAWAGAPGRENYGKIEDPDNAGAFIDAPMQRYKVTQTLAPEQQALFDLSNEAATKYGEIGNTQLDAVRDSFESPFSVESLGAAPVANEEMRASTRDNMLSRLQGQRDYDRRRTETTLANQGFQSGTEAYDQQMDQFNRGENDLYLAADAQAGNEMARMYGLEANTRDRAINEMLMERNQPLTELSAFMSGSQPGAPNFVGTPQGQIAAPDFMGAEFASANQANSANQNAYNQQMGSYNQNLAGLYGLAGAGAKAWGWKK